ncbi:hypothetical protein K2P97_03825 [bacterium]|nr:hypothetical protein [bacterium]
MKTFLTILTLAAMSSANANCLGEAQIIATVKDIKSRDMMMGCTVTVTPETIKLYNESRVCPLDLNEVLTEGIEVGLSNGHDCTYNPGDEFSGVIVKKAWGTLVLE